MFTITAQQMRVLASSTEVQTEDRALRHLQNCVPEVCAALSEAELRTIIAWGRRRSKQYGIEKEYDFFRYLNLMFMFGFEFDTASQYPWAIRTLTKKGHPSARIDLLMDYAMLHCSRAGKGANQ
ncbi:MAG TPA: hypothetical protein VGL72_06495 [Bryobacteraceae bacterium]|jgi:hypothetical protein